MALLDRCIFLAVSGGTGTFVEASAVTGYQTMEAAGALDTNLYSYAAQSADLSQWEYGIGTYSLGGTSLARTTVLGNSLGGTSPINFTNPPQVMLTALNVDFTGGNIAPLFLSTNEVHQSNTTTAQAFSVYNTTDSNTSPTNFERGVFDWVTTTNVLTIGTQVGGTGSNQRDINFSSAGNNGSGNFHFSQDNTPSTTGFSIIVVGEDESSGALGIITRSDCGLYWSSTTLPNAGSGLSNVSDTGMSRSAAGVVAFGNGNQGDASACIKAKTKAGAPTTSDVPAGTWVLIRDTTNNTTKIYYNNAGTLISSVAFS